jgi:16S rRNA (guanine527-N7)-methyltransferase
MISDEWLLLAKILPDVSRETISRLERFEHLLGEWNPRINLVAPATMAHLRTRHVLDSAQLYPLLGAAKSIVDIGSGAGFPGLVLAILMQDQPGRSIALVESNRKKCAFLHVVASELQLSATVHPQRIDDYVARAPVPDLVTARALASLSELMAMTEPWLKGATRGIFQKGRDYRRELTESADKWCFDLVESPSKIDRAGVILEIRNLSRRATR